MTQMCPTDITGDIKTYSSLIKIQSFAERFQYLLLNGSVAEETFGSGRYYNQAFYRSDLWRHIKRQIILRDQACNLGVPGFEINTAIYVHHIVPITIDDIIYQTDRLLNPDNLICTDLETHNAIHYGTCDFIKSYEWTPRQPNDLFPWRDI